MAKAIGLRVGEVAQRAGLLPTTLRYYESIGLLPNPQRENGSRRYDASVFERLEMIRTAQQAGFTLAEIRVLFDEILWNEAPAAKWNSLIQRKLTEIIQRKLTEINGMLVNIQNMKHLLEDILECDNEHLAECIFQMGQKHRHDLIAAD